MATYFIFETTTRDGAMTVSDAPQRAAKTPEIAADFGVRVVEWFFTTAQCDFVMKVEADDEASVAAFVMAIRRGGNVEARFARAFAPEEWADMVARLDA